MKLPVTTLLPQRSNRSGPARFPRVCIACIPVLLSLVSFAQIEQKGRVEISPKAYKITLAGEKGIIAYNVDSNYVGSYGQNRLQFIRYDTNMVRKYIVEHFIPGRLHFEQTYLDDTYFYLLFNNPRHSRIAIFRLDILSSVGEWIPGNSLVRHLQVTDFKVMQSQALIAGRIKANDNPVVIEFNLFHKQSRILPDIYDKRVMAKSVSLHTDPEKNQFYATVFDQRCNTYMKTYSREGRLLNDIFIEHHSGNVAASLYVVNNSPTEQLAIGNYSSDCGSSLQGLYSATIQNGRQTSIRYYPFSRFRNFFDHLPAARQNRIADRIEQRHSAGKEFSLKENFWATQAVSEKNGQYISVGELFHLPQMGIDRVTTQYQSANRAVAAGFDTKGDLLWTNTYALPASDSLANPSLITLNMEKDAMRIAYITRTHLHTLLLGEYDQTMRLETYPINERFPEDELLEHPVARIEHWYKDKYLLFGVQVLRNYERNRKGEMRQVLYLIQLKIPELTTQAPAENR